MTSKDKFRKEMLMALLEPTPPINIPNLMAALKARKEVGARLLTEETLPDGLTVIAKRTRAESRKLIETWSQRLS